MVGRAEARQHHQLGAVIGAGAHQHFALGADDVAFAIFCIGDAGGAVVFDQDAVNPRLGNDRQLAV
ncbi:hypothetical protein D3C71_2098650 [compost metagenome]